MSEVAEYDRRKPLDASQPDFDEVQSGVRHLHAGGQEDLGPARGRAVRRDRFGPRLLRGDEWFTRGQTFKEWVLSQDDDDLSRFVFTGPRPEAELAHLLAVSDLQIDLAVPFVLS